MVTHAKRTAPQVLNKLTFSLLVQTIGQQPRVSLCLKILSGLSQSPKEW
jgi:hypothetical protein